MRNKTAIASFAAGLIGLGVIAAPVAAYADTPTSFVLTGGGLSLTEPVSATLTTGAVGDASVSGSLGDVTVADYQGGASDAWTATVTTTDFVGTTNGTDIPGSDVAYYPGTAIAGAATFGTPATPGDGGTIGTGETAFSQADAVGSNGVEWDPTITVTLPAGVTAETYDGEITESVA
jgi:hypothetical protein